MTLSSPRQTLGNQFCHVRRYTTKKVAYSSVIFSGVCKKVAHKLARLACNFSSLHVWIETVPPDTVDAYFFEVP